MLFTAAEALRYEKIMSLLNDDYDAVQIDIVRYHPVKEALILKALRYIHGLIFECSSISSVRLRDLYSPFFCYNRVIRGYSQGVFTSDELRHAYIEFIQLTAMLLFTPLLHVADAKQVSSILLNGGIDYCKWVNRMVSLLNENPTQRSAYDILLFVIRMPLVPLDLIYVHGYDNHVYVY